MPSPPPAGVRHQQTLKAEEDCVTASYKPSNLLHMSGPSLGGEKEVHEKRIKMKVLTINSTLKQGVKRYPSSRLSRSTVPTLTN